MFGLDKSDIQNIINKAKSIESIDELCLFGSRAMGNYTSGSDIDIALKGDNLNLNTILELSMAIDELELPYQFDLVIYDRINEAALKKHIDTAGHTIYKKYANNN